jgi:hypothetical protein
MTNADCPERIRLIPTTYRNGKWIWDENVKREPEDISHATAVEYIRADLVDAEKELSDAEVARLRKGMDDRRCLECGRTRDEHFDVTIRAKCPSGDVWGLYDPERCHRRAAASTPVPPPPQEPKRCKPNGSRWS